MDYHQELKTRSSPYFTDFEVFKSIRNDYVNKKYDERNKDGKDWW